MTQPAPAVPFDPVQAADDEARALARKLLTEASHASLSYTDAAAGVPGISRIAFGWVQGGPVTLVSSLAPHSAGMRAHPACAVMVGEPGERGDPLNHPRLMIRARAEFVAADDPARAQLREDWLEGHPKSKLYVDFKDFAFVRLHLVEAMMNGGFAKAFRYTLDDFRF